MDKKSLIGFLLIMVVLILWPMWNKIFKNDEQPASTPIEQTSPESTATTQASPETTAQAPAQVTTTTPQQQMKPSPGPVDTLTSMAEKLVTVETDNIIAVMSSRGGVIKSLKLKHYNLENGESDSLVEMLAGNSQNPWPVNGALTIGDETTVLPLNNMTFTPSSESFTLKKGDEPKVLSFTYTDPSGASVRKDFTFNPRTYQIKFRLTVDNPKALGLNEKLTVGWLVPELPSDKNLKEDLSKFAGFYSMGGEVVENKSLKEGKLELIASGKSDWVANRSKYFTNAMITEKEPGSEVMILGSQANLVDHEGKNQEWKKFGMGLTFDLKGDKFSNDFLIYSGPLDYFRLEKIGFNLGQLVDMGWKVFRPFAIGILWIFIQMHKVLFNYGLVIIIFSIVMKLVFWPLTRKSSTSMMKMREIQPKLQEIKEKFGKDPKRLNEETMKMYKEYGVNPFGSCLPILVQLPIFWALFSVLRNSIELRAADFVFWITDLSQKDPTWVLPVLMGLAMFFQQKMTINDPKQKMMAYIMPVVFVFIFGSMPSGLVLYWTIFSVIGIFEQLVIKRRLDEEKRLAASQ